MSINILDFNFTPSATEFHNLYKIKNIITGEDDRLHDIFELHYIELRKFRKEYSELVKPLDRWLAFLTQAHALNKASLPEPLSSDKLILKAIEAVDRMFDEEERLVYQIRRQILTDSAAIIASAEEKGQKRGIKQGISIGMEQAKTELTR